MDSTSELRPHVNSPVDVLGPSRRHHDDRERNLMTLNVLLLGDRQSGRSSVGNALIGQKILSLISQILHLEIL